MDEIIPFQIALVLAGVLYIITPGPVFLAIISLVSEQNRKAGLKFIFGAIFGCAIWITITITTIIEAENLPKELFITITVLCSSYLFYLGYKMITKSLKNNPDLIFKKPIKDGFVLALFNPKSYPVMASIFGSISFQYTENIQWESFFDIFTFSVFGFALGYLFMIFMASVKIIKKIYSNNIRVVSSLFGVVFIYFGVTLLLTLL